MQFAQTDELNALENDALGTEGGEEEPWISFVIEPTTYNGTLCAGIVR